MLHKFFFLIFCTSMCVAMENAGLEFGDGPEYKKAFQTVFNAIQRDNKDEELAVATLEKFPHLAREFFKFDATWDKSTENFLLLSALYGLNKVAKKLIELKAPLGFAGKDQYLTPLMNAAYHGHEEICRMLIHAGANVNEKTTGTYGDRTALHNAAAKSNPNIVHMLLTSGAKVDPKDALQDTPLHTAARCNRVENAQLLLRAGADANAKRSDGDTPLTYAIANKNANMQKYLEDYDAKVCD